MLRKLGMLWKSSMYLLNALTTHGSFFMFRRFDGNGFCVSWLMDKEFVFLGLDGRRHPNDKRSNQIVDWEGVDMIGGELARLVMNVDDDYGYDGYKDDDNDNNNNNNNDINNSNDNNDEMMMVMMAIK